MTVAVWTRRRAVQAGGTATAGYEVGIGNPVSLMQGLAKTIRSYLLAQAEHLADHLVAGNDGQTLGEAGSMAPPNVEIGAADVGTAHLNQDIVWPHLW